MHQHQVKPKTTTKVLATLLTLTLFGCSETPNQESHAKHQWGKTISRTSPLLPCKDGDSPAYEDHRGYLRKHINYIADKNPQVFTGNLSKEKFCVSIDQSDEPNASADSMNGSVDMTLGLVRIADNAGVVAHELAHITMGHYEGMQHDQIKYNTQIKEFEKKYNDIFLNVLDINKFHEIDKFLFDIQVRAGVEKGYYAKQGNVQEILEKMEYTLSRFDTFFDEYLNNSPEEKEKWSQGIHELKSMHSALQSSLQSSSGQKLLKQAQQLDDEKAKFIDQLLDQGKGASFNWMEQEADEVGFEFYVRAGFLPSQYAEFHRKMLNTKDRETCKRTLEEGKIPPRGEETHPQGCWRLNNIDQTESLKHSAEIEKYLGNTVNIFPGELAKLKATLTPKSNSTSAEDSY